MSENTHYKVPADELLQALPVDPPQEGAKCIYEEPELPNHLMQVQMTPLADEEAPRTTFLVKDWLYVPRTVYRILSKTLSPIKGHNSDTKEVVGVMKNLIYNIIHGIPINIQDFFMRTLATIAQSPFDLKPYAPWIIRFIRSRTSIDYKADCQNHLSFLPEVGILQRTISSVPGKGKAVVDEGLHPLDGQFRQPASQSMGDDSASQDTNANASAHFPQSTAPRVMTNQELLISLNQKVDRNHDWVKRQLAAILANLTVTQNSVRKNHYYAHEIFDRSWAILSHLKTSEELEEMEFQQDFDWSIPPKKKFKKVQVPPLVPSSASPSRSTDENEIIEDTATGPSTSHDPNTDAGAPPTSS